MKLKQYVLLSVMLQCTATIHASDLIIEITTTTSNLNNAQAALASLLGIIATQTTPANTSSLVDAADNTSESTATETGTNNADSNSNTDSGSSTSPDDNSTANPGASSSAPTAPQDPIPVNNNPIVAPVVTPINAPASFTTIVNNAHETVTLAMFDQNSQQINPASITLVVDAFSYIPSNVATIKVVDSKNQQLVAATPITQNSLYAVTNVNNAWTIAMLPAPVTYKYTNATTIPLIVTITVGDHMYSQQIAPAGVYALTVDAAEMVVINAHVNIAGIATSYNSALSYSLTINTQNELDLTPTTETDNSLTNNSGWPILVTTIALNDDKNEMELDDGENFKPENTTNFVMITPLILNQASASAPAKSCTIASENGQLVLQF